MVPKVGKWLRLVLAAAVGLSCSTSSISGQDKAEESLKVLRASADHGDADAQFTLGFMYEKGQGLPQDYPEAIRWYRKAADQGDCVFCSGAQVNLGLMYANGEGVTQNYAEAARWYRKAADQGDAKAQVTVQVPQSIFLDKSRRIVYCMVDECESESPRKATWGSGEWPSALQPTQP
jgi:hypothetical protein